MPEQSVVVDLPETQGYLLEIGKRDDRWRIAAKTPTGQTIASAREVTGLGWLVIAAAPGSPDVAARFDTEADALKWLNYIADLHTAAVTG
ncbi:hypothetical protein E2F47_01770 [Mycobacterium eburneum]|nr:hypothetical protein [Mycobacterium eburneum]TDH57524.1 hypothetical protein E2F47_01770 [Mycobacterium eburneum]